MVSELVNIVKLTMVFKVNYSLKSEKVSEL